MDAGDIYLDQLFELEGEYGMCRMPNNTWLIKTPKIISVRSVFTGLYI